eukprot:gene14987-biopygen7492
MCVVTGFPYPYGVVIVLHAFSPSTSSPKPAPKQPSASPIKSPPSKVKRAAERAAQRAKRAGELKDICLQAAVDAARPYREKFPALKCALLGVRRGVKGSYDADPGGLGAHDMICFEWSGFAAAGVASAAIVEGRLDHIRDGTAVSLPPALMTAECQKAADD